MGVDPYTVIDQDNENYLIKVAMLRRAVEIRREEREELAQMIGRYFLSA